MYDFSKYASSYFTGSLYLVSIVSSPLIGILVVGSVQVSCLTHSC